MNILVPKEITPEMFGAGTTIPAVDTDAGEAAWTEGQDCVVGDRRVHGNYIFECIKEVAGSPANTYEPDTGKGGEFWFKDETAPSNRWAPFDEYHFTKARHTGEVKYVIKAGFANGVAVHAIEADALTVTYTDGEGGPELAPTYEADMWQQAFGLWEYLFSELQRTVKQNVKGAPLHPNLVITITASRTLPDQDAAIGYIRVGNWNRLFAPRSLIGAAVTGASAEPKSYSYFKQNEDGTYVRRRGRQSIDLSIGCVVDAEEGNRVRRILDEILDVPVPMEASDVPQYAWLSTVGFINGRMSAPNRGVVDIEFKVKGNV